MGVLLLTRHVLIFLASSPFLHAATLTVSLSFSLSLSLSFSLFHSLPHSHSLTRSPPIRVFDLLSPLRPPSSFLSTISHNQTSSLHSFIPLPTNRQTSRKRKRPRAKQRSTYTPTEQQDCAGGISQKSAEESLKSTPTKIIFFRTIFR